MGCVAPDNDSVQKLQQLLNVKVDGKLGGDTYGALRRYFLDNAADVMKNLPLAIQPTLAAYTALLNNQGVVPVLPYLQGMDFDEREVEEIGSAVEWYQRCVSQDASQAQQQQQQQTAPIVPTNGNIPPTVGITAIPPESNTWKWVVGGLLAAGALGLIYYMYKNKSEEGEEMAGTTCGCGK